MITHSKFLVRLLFPVIVGVIAAAAASGSSMKTQVYNPGANGIFPVSSVLVTGEKEALLIDAQFSTADAAKLVELVRASGKRLTTILITCGDPDFYFGLETLKAAFPEVKIVATKPVVEHIEHSYEKKLAYWGPILGAGAPKKIIVPEVLPGSLLQFEGKTVEIVGFDSPLPDRTFVWIPAIKTVVGSVPVFGGMHIFLADTNTPATRAAWRATLDQILTHHPDVVVPGHFGPGAPQTIESVKFTSNYIQAFEEELGRTQNSTELIAAMQKRFPQLTINESLKISAKVAKGEMPW